ncbi:FMN-binding protein MioC [Alteromonas oceanisediminis]|uniref:FMN-binding protein MioC n=1 Tax=Alteromonas oceanisediminis TaxID=2836180 RepID=UPI001BD95ED2|nr:FMN-binding protein MioC [Alteromonas oceanisediminis]MBT0586713.1 FMN-binding protein MioC [Alteromonas oceanisediminis]
MANVQIIVGSVLGASEYVADALAEKLRECQHEVDIHLEPDANEIARHDHWIICSSTHGAGDFPDNIQRFATQLNQLKLDPLPFCVIALGDSSYDTFCEAGNKLHQLMLKSGAKPQTDVFEIDVLQHPIPEDVAVEWLAQHHPLMVDKNP